MRVLGGWCLLYPVLFISTVVLDISNSIVMNQFTPCSPMMAFTTFQKETNENNKIKILKRALLQFLNARSNVSKALRILADPAHNFRAKQQIATASFHDYNLARKTLLQLHQASQTANQSDTSLLCSPDVSNYALSNIQPSWAKRALLITDLISRSRFADKICTAHLMCPKLSIGKDTGQISWLIQNGLDNLENFQKKNNTRSNSSFTNSQEMDITHRGTLCIRSSTEQCSFFILNKFIEKWKQNHNHSYETLNRIRILSYGDDHVLPSVLNLDHFGNPWAWRQLIQIDPLTNFNLWQNFEYINQQNNLNINNNNNNNDIFINHSHMNNNWVKEDEFIENEQLSKQMLFELQRDTHRLQHDWRNTISNWSSLFELSWYSTNLIAKNKNYYPIPIGIADFNARQLIQARIDLLTMFEDDMNNNEEKDDLINGTNNNQNLNLNVKNINSKKRRPSHFIKNQKYEKRHLVLLNFKSRSGPHGSHERLAIYRKAVLGLMNLTTNIISTSELIHHILNGTDDSVAVNIITKKKTYDGKFLIEKGQEFDLKLLHLLKEQDWNITIEKNKEKDDSLLQQKMNTRIKKAIEDDDDDEDEEEEKELLLVQILKKQFRNDTKKELFFKIEKLLRLLKDEHNKSWLWADIEPRFMSSRWADDDLGAYFRELSSYHFVLSPRGNGLDCFRTWEALAVGTVASRVVK